MGGGATRRPPRRFKNTGLTCVGACAIDANGIASGFDGYNDYISTSNASFKPNGEPWKIQIKFRHPNFNFLVVSSSQDRTFGNLLTELTGADYRIVIWVYAPTTPDSNLYISPSLKRDGVQLSRLYTDLGTGRPLGKDALPLYAGQWMYACVERDASGFWQAALRDRNYRLLARSEVAAEPDWDSDFIGDLAFGYRQPLGTGAEIDFAETFFSVNGVITSPWSK